jgi:hypothetical protein
MELDLSCLSAAAFLHPISIKEASISQGAQIRRLFLEFPFSHDVMSIIPGHRTAIERRSQAQTPRRAEKKASPSPLGNPSHLKITTFRLLPLPKKKVAYFYHITSFVLKQTV